MKNGHITISRPDNLTAQESQRYKGLNRRKKNIFHNSIGSDEETDYPN